MSLFIKRESSWQFITSSSGGLGVEFVMAEGGKIWLQDPAGKVVSYFYGGAGAGWAAGLKLPKIGKVQLKVRGKGVGGAVAPAAFPNAGKLYVLETCATNELVASDIQGACIFVEAFGGVVAGAYATAMIFGMSPLWLAAALSFVPLGPVTMTKLLASATGVLVMGGASAGVQAGIGVGAFVGGLY